MELLLILAWFTVTTAVAALVLWVAQVSHASQGPAVDDGALLLLS